jgi:hypothetical protein
MATFRLQFRAATNRSRNNVVEAAHAALIGEAELYAAISVKN